MGRRWGARRAALLGVTFAYALFGASSAPAAFAVVNIEVVAARNALKITGDAGSNHAFLDYKDKVFTLVGSGEPESVGNGCVLTAAGAAECAGDRASVYVDLGEGDNIFEAFQVGSFNGHLPVIYKGHAGKDSVTGGEASLEMVDGGAGSDTIRTGGSSGSAATKEERLIGGPDGDTLVGGKGPDLIDGGAGPDHMFGDGQFGENAHLDGVDVIDAADAGDKFPSSGAPQPDGTIDCGGQVDSYQRDEVDDTIPPKNCEKEQVVTVQLAGAGDPAAGAQPGKPKPEEKVTAEFEAGKKIGAQISGAIVIPKAAGKDQKPKLAPFSLMSAPLGATVARKKKTVIPIKSRTITLRPGVERLLGLDFSPRTERALRRSLEGGGLPALKVTIEALGKKGGRGARRDTDRLEFGL